jgi:hypothetical protein
MCGSDNSTCRSRCPATQIEAFGRAQRHVIFARLPIVKNTIVRAAIEAGILIFFLYAILLMAEFGRYGKGTKMGLAWAVADILTPANFAIAITAALVGCIVVEFLRNKFQSGNRGIIRQLNNALLFRF